VTLSVREEWLSIAMGVALLTASPGSPAAEVAKHPCAHVRDDADRLACYDQAFGKPAEPVAAAPEKFGLPEKETPRQLKASGETAAPSSVTSTITTVSRQRDGKFVVTLDNAQVWSQSETSSQADVEVGDAITVRRGALGSYLLVTKAGIATRVRRVK
jgi:hypothetical protein